MTTAVTALFCSTIFQKSATSLISTYLIIVVMFMAPVAVTFFAETFFSGTSRAAVVDKLGVLSPFSATFALPLDVSRRRDAIRPRRRRRRTCRCSSGTSAGRFVYNGVLILAMMRLFQVRWRVAD